MLSVQRITVVTSVVSKVSKILFQIGYTVLIHVLTVIMPGKAIVAFPAVLNR